MTMLVSAQQRFQHLPYVLSRDVVFSRPATPSSIDDINERLRDYTRRAGVDAVYIKYLLHDAPVGALGWYLHYLLPLREVHTKARTSVVLIVLPILLLLAAYLYTSSRRISSGLDQSKLKEQALLSMNVKMEEEIEVRRRAPTRLENAQNDLERASALAALGELSASVTHELGQPIAAMQNYLASAELPDSDLGRDGSQLLSQIKRLVNRMQHITH